MPSPSDGNGGSGVGDWCSRKRWYLIVLVFLVTHIALAVPEGDWDNCPSACKCKFVHGRKMAECSKANYDTVPDQLSSEIQWIDLSENNFVTLPKDAFKQVGLINLQKIFLKSCGIETLDKDALSGLVLLIEIDLTDNLISKLHPSTFKENFRLRVLYLNRNPLEKLENDLFSNHTYLQTLDFTDCKIKHIGPKTFTNVPILQHLMLAGNRMEYLRLSTVSSLTKLKSLVLTKNPWRCDCKLRPLRDWVFEKNLNAKTTCAEPARLHEKHWVDVKSEDFACKPQLVLPSVSIAAYPGENVTLSCRTAGDPAPEVSWVFSSLILSNSTRPAHAGFRQHYLLQRGEARTSVGEYWTWTNLTILDTKHYDSGKYSCGAKNPGGVAEEVLTLGIREGRGGFIINGETNVLWTWLVGLVILAFLLLIGVLLLCFFLCRKNGRRNAHNRNSVIKKQHETQLTSNGDIINGEEDQEKAPLTKVNPLQKPPRRMDSKQSSLNGSQAGDLSRVGADLTASSVRPRGSEGSGDHSQSDDHLLGRSYDSLDSDAPATMLVSQHHQGGGTMLLPGAGNISNTSTLPSNVKLSPNDRQTLHSRPDSTRPCPDLLAFPPRGAGHDSPAGSSTSTVPDNTRLNLLQLGSPVILSPPHSAGYTGTLPYNRSHSPFSPVLLSPPSSMGSCGSLPVVVTRQGYVTIPRRPRAPSWAAPMRPGDPLNKLEPIYDNLGPRTTADGSSILSLNKVGNGCRGGGTLTKPQRSNVPRSSPMQATSPLPMYYAPIEEIDHVPSPAPIRHKMTPPADTTNNNKSSRTPQEGVASVKNKISPRKETASPVKKMIISPRSSPIATQPIEGPRKNNNNINNNNNSVKIPPKVPPKPKKKPQTVNGGGSLEKGAEALYEDEGEDGTEV